MIKQLSTKIVYQNKFMKVHEDQVEFPNGLIGIYGVVDKINYSLIIPYQDGFFYLVKQYRYPIKKQSLEFPAGRTEGKKLPPEEVAKNELREETGLIAGNIEKIGFLHTSPASMNVGGHIYLATDLTQSTRELDKSESDLTVHKVSIREFEHLVITGEICEFPTLGAYGLLKIKKPTMV